MRVGLATGTLVGRGYASLRELGPSGRGSSRPLHGSRDANPYVHQGPSRHLLPSLRPTSAVMNLAPFPRAVSAPSHSHGTHTFTRCTEELTQQHQDAMVRGACLPRAAWPRVGTQWHGSVLCCDQTVGPTGSVPSTSLPQPSGALVHQAEVPRDQPPLTPWMPHPLRLPWAGTLHAWGTWHGLHRSCRRPASAPRI